MSELYELIIGFGSAAFLVLLGLIVGRTTERRHFRNLAGREQALSSMLVTDIKTFPHADAGRPGAQFVTGEAAIGADYFKMFLATIRGLIGGEVRSYGTLAERARREALARMLEQARAMGFTGVCNVRLATADIAGTNTAKKKIVCVCVLATGTAYHAAPPAHA